MGTWTCGEMKHKTHSPSSKIRSEKTQAGWPCLISIQYTIQHIYNTQTWPLTYMSEASCDDNLTQAGTGNDPPDTNTSSSYRLSLLDLQTTSLHSKTSCRKLQIDYFAPEWVRPSESRHADSASGRRGVSWNKVESRKFQSQSRNRLQALSKMSSNTSDRHRWMEEKYNSPQ